MIEESKPLVCEFCGETKIAKLFKKNGFDIVECTPCGLSFISPIPTPEKVAEFYSGSEKVWNDSELETSNVWFTKKFIRSFSGKGRLLEIGCSDGRLLEGWRREGNEAVGVEISPRAAEKARKRTGCEVFEIDFMEKEFPSDSFDVVVLLRVLEHLRNPFAYLKKINAVLKPNGLLVVGIPNYRFGKLAKKISAIIPPLQRIEETIGVFGPPSHLFHYSPRVISRVLEKVGFDDVHVRNCFPTFDHGQHLRNFLKFFSYSSSEILYYMTMKRIVLNYSMIIGARKKEDALPSKGALAGQHSRYCL